MPIDDGIIIINEATARISTDGGQEALVRGTHLVTFERSATINGTEFVNLRKTIDKQPGVARSPLLNIVGHDPALSMPLLQRMNNDNLHFIQGFKDEVDAAGSPKLSWLE